MIEELEQVAGRSVSRETFDRIGRYMVLLRAASTEQNLIAASTLDDLWARHILDSAQLVRFGTRFSASWVDIGSGAGLPGIVVALLVQGFVTLVEPRRLRAEFLQLCVGELDLAPRARVVRDSIANLGGNFDVITARAVAPLDRLLGLASHLSRSGTIWVLPKGKNAKSELAEAQRSWHCEVRTEASRTDPQASILVLSKVGKR